MSASARLVKPEIGTTDSVAQTGPAEPTPLAAEPVQAAGAETSSPAEAPVVAAPKGKKGVLYKGICVFCGEKIEISVERREAVCFAFCNSECKARFDADMNAALD